MASVEVVLRGASSVRVGDGRWCLTPDFNVRLSDASDSCGGDDDGDGGGGGDDGDDGNDGNDDENGGASSSASGAATDVSGHRAQNGSIGGVGGGGGGEGSGGIKVGWRGDENVVGVASAATSAAASAAASAEIPAVEGGGTGVTVPGSHRRGWGRGRAAEGAGALPEPSQAPGRAGRPGRRWGLGRRRGLGGLVTSNGGQRDAATVTAAALLLGEHGDLDGGRIGDRADDSVKQRRRRSSRELPSPGARVGAEARARVGGDGVSAEGATVDRALLLPWRRGDPEAASVGWLQVHIRTRIVKNNTSESTLSESESSITPGIFIFVASSIHARATTWQH